MADFILMEGDEAEFLPTFGSAIVMVKPGVFKSASGKAFTRKKKICVKGDEEKVKVEGVKYVSGGFIIPGTGDLTIKKLAGDQVAKKTFSDGKEVLLKGTMFEALFTVKGKAKMPQPPKPPQDDPLGEYNGKGMFKTKNKTFKGS